MKQEFLDKILNILDDKSEIIGGALGFISDPIADGRGLSGEALTFMMDRVKNWKLTNPFDVISNMLYYENSYPIMNSVGAAVGGWLLNELGGIIDPKISKLGRAVKKIGVSSALGMFIGANIWLPAVMNTGGGTGNGTGTTGTGGTVTY